MSRSEKRAYLEAIRRRYKKSNRSQKAKILDEFCAICNYNRKYAIRLLYKRRNKVCRKPGRIHDIEDILPFEILGFDCDNGSEFLNYHLLRYFTKRDKVVQFTRSRPYRKNDNAHVEQKNWTHVRHLFGYDRFDNPKVVALMNDLYKNEWSQYQNHFCPTMKLIEKKKINSKYYKKYDIPKTPDQRLIDSEHISEEAKDRLRKQHQTLNPFVLKRSIEEKLKKIFKFISVTANVRNRL
jgi:hypothetical protein